MTWRRIRWALFLTLFAGLLVLYAVGIASAWDAGDGGRTEEIATIVAIVFVPGVVFALAASLANTSGRGMRPIAATSVAGAVAAIVVSMAERAISGLVVTACVLIFAAAGAVAWLVESDRLRVARAAGFAAALALLVGVAVGFVTGGAAILLSVALAVVAMTAARRRLLEERVHVAEDRRD